MKKILIKNNISNNIVYFDGTNWVNTGLIEPLLDSDYINKGMENVYNVPQAKWDELDDDITLMVWSDTTLDSNNFIASTTKSTYFPINIINNPVVSTYYLNNKDLLINLNVTATNQMRFLLSKDNRNTWWTYKKDSDTWQQVSINNIKTDGITQTDLYNMTDVQFTEWFKRGYLDVAIWINEQSNDTSSLPYLNSLIVNFPQNNYPIINNFNIYPNVVNRDNVLISAGISELEGDNFRYRIIINNTILDWSNWFDGETTNNILKTVDYNLFKEDVNTVILQVQDNRNTSINSYQKNVKMINNNPTFTTLSYDDFLVSGIITDDDNDMVRYRILINNAQVYPYVKDTGIKTYTDFLQTPYNFDYMFNSKNIIIGKQNNITIEVLDKFGGIASSSFIVNGKYNNLMLKDNNGNYLSNDNGELLRYLIFGNDGSIVNNSMIKKVTLENEYSYTIYDANISANKSNNDFDIWFNYNDNFDTYYENLNLGSILANSTKDFYIKVNLHKDIINYNDNLFNIIVTGHK
jgi:hypothetical protein